MEGGLQVKRNGFQRPFHPLQVVSWVVFGSDVAIFAALFLPLLEGHATQAVVGVFFALSVVSLVASAAHATKCDPADPHIYNKETPLDPRKNSLYYCDSCNSNVSQRSKHCRACDKCVHNFDHHCKWLNNCVGRDNYRSFATAIGSVAIMTGIVLGCCLHLFLEYVTDGDAFDLRLQQVYEGSPKELSIGMLCIMIFINFPLFVLDLQLVILHIFLTSKNMTTYEYIQHKRDQEILAEEAGGGEPKASARSTLPRCMDWIVYKRRRPKGHEHDKNGTQNDEQPNGDGRVAETGFENQSQFTIDGSIADVNGGSCGFDDDFSDSLSAPGCFEKQIGIVVHTTEDRPGGSDGERRPDDIHLADTTLIHVPDDMMSTASFYTAGGSLPPSRNLSRDCGEHLTAALETHDADGNFSSEAESLAPEQTAEELYVSVTEGDMASPRLIMAKPEVEASVEPTHV